MTVSPDRRSVLTGVAALGVVGCTRTPARANQTPPRDIDDAPGRINPPVLETIDLSALEARGGGRLGFAIHDVDAGRFLRWRADERFVYCSTFKAYLAAATLLRVQSGQERLDRAIPITRADMISHAPVTEPAIGASLTVEALMKGTVEVSDNPAANILIREMGGLDALRGFYRGIGDDDTRVDRLEPEMNRLDGDKDTITPARSVLNLFRLFVIGDVLNVENQDRLLKWMVDTPTGPNRIKAGVPAGWRVAHKTGTGGYGPVNDIGLLYPPTGRPLVIAAYFHGTRESSDERREAVIADATRIALEQLGHV